jgi:2-dehydro-3-deoxyphosphogluconate aldolase / (4S)-4-hydroxy-2-oxoglutarate aldolase
MKLPHFISRFVPVVEIDDATHAIPLAHALLAGGVDVIEITLRTAHALPAIEAIAKDGVPIALGAGTVLSALQLTACADAGARFAISPGASRSLLEAGANNVIPFIPGVATPSEAMSAAELGYTLLKLFPAAAVGGVPLLKGIAGPLPELHFIPTGGIDAKNANEFLALPNVRAVGGSWLAPRKLIAAKDWAGITALAKAATSAVQSATV